MPTLGGRKMRGEKRREEKNAERRKQQQTDALDAIYACEWVKERQWGKIVMAVWIEEKKPRFIVHNSMMSRLFIDIMEVITKR